MNTRLLDHAIAEFKKFRGHSRVKVYDKIVIVDYSIHSKHKRLHVVRVKDKKVLRSHHVAHGINSSDPRRPGRAVRFSNKVMSKCSSVGAAVTGSTYRWGKRFPTPTKLKIHGLEDGINNNIFKRAIVFHSSKYVTDRFIARTGYAGRSWGCPAVDPAISESLLNEIKDGVFVYLNGRTL